MISRYFEKRTVMHFGFAILVVALLFNGPSETLGFPDKLYMLLIGLGITGIGAASTVIPIIPEIIDGCKGKFESEAKVRDLSSGIFAFWSGIG